MNRSSNPEAHSSPRRLVAGFLTIGESPRPDLLDDMRRRLGVEADHSGTGAPTPQTRDVRLEILEAGALDGLSPDSLALLRPGPREASLLTRLADATPVVVGKKKVVPLLNRQIAALESRGAGLVALLCTEDFADLQNRVPLLLPWQVLSRIAALLPFALPLGVLAPLSAQRDSMRRRWQRATDREVVVQIADPYAADPHAAPPDWDHIARRFVRERVAAIVLDCFGYTAEHERLLRQATGKPVLAPRALLAESILSLASDPALLPGPAAPGHSSA